MPAVTIHDARRSEDGSEALAFDLIEVLQVVGHDADTSTWRCHDVECNGDLADELHRAAEAGALLLGHELLRIAAGILQVIDGNFEAYRFSQTRPWLVIRAVDSSQYVVVTEDPGVIERVRASFQDVRPSPHDEAYLL